MHAELTLLHLVVAVIATIFVVIGTLLSVFLPLFKRNDRSIERLDEKLDRSIERLDAKINHSVEQLRADIYLLDA